MPLGSKIGGVPTFLDGKVQIDPMRSQAEQAGRFSSHYTFTLRSAIPPVKAIGMERLVPSLAVACILYSRYGF